MHTISSLLVCGHELKKPNKGKEKMINLFSLEATRRIEYISAEVQHVGMGVEQEPYKNAVTKTNSLETILGEAKQSFN